MARVTVEDCLEVVDNQYDLVILANWIVNSQKFGFSGHENPEHPSDALLARLNIHPTHLEPICSSVEAELEMTEDFCKMLEDA